MLSILLPTGFLQSSDKNPAQEPSRLPKSFHAFTLTELLVTIAIIAILVVLAVPQYSKIKGSATKGKCAANLKQLGVAFHLYLADNDNKFPSSIHSPSPGTPIQQWEDVVAYGGWKANTPSIEKAYGTFLHCPNHFDEPDMHGSISYVGNWNLFPAAPSQVSYSAIVQPSRKVMFFEVHTKALDLFAGTPSATGKRPWAPALTYHSHGTSDNFLFCDGHVESTASQRADDWRFWEIDKTPPDFPF